MSQDTVWKAVAVVCIAGLVGGAVERGVFADTAATDKDMATVIRRLDLVTTRLDSVSDRLSKVEGKMDVVIENSRIRSGVDK